MNDNHINSIACRCFNCIIALEKYRDIINTAFRDSIVYGSAIVEIIPNGDNDGLIVKNIDLFDESEQKRLLEIYGEEYKEDPMDILVEEAQRLKLGYD